MLTYKSWRNTQLKRWRNESELTNKNARSGRSWYRFG
jgi:hypothetical protein